MNRRTCVPARQRQRLHVTYQVCYHFLKNTKKYRRGDARQNPPEIPGSYTPAELSTRIRNKLVRVRQLLQVEGYVSARCMRTQQQTTAVLVPAHHCQITAVAMTLARPLSLRFKIMVLRFSYGSRIQ